MPTDWDKPFNFCDGPGTFYIIECQGVGIEVQMADSQTFVVFFTCEECNVDGKGLIHRMRGMYWNAMHNEHSDRRAPTPGLALEQLFTRFTKELP